MTICCAPNPVNVAKECTLWCELPENLTRGDGEASSKLGQCLRNSGQNLSLEATGYSAASLGSITAVPLTTRAACLVVLLESLVSIAL